MGKLYCLKCKQEVEANTFAEANSLIDHAAKSIRCAGKDNNLRWNGERVVGTVSLLDKIPAVITAKTVPPAKKSATKKKA